MAGDLDFSDIATQSWVPAIDEVAMQVRTPARLQASNSCSSLETGLGANVGLLSRMLDELDYGLMLVTDDARVRLANREAKRECASSQCMRLRDGHVHPRQDSERPAFFKALAASRLGRRTMLTLGPREAPLSLAVVPVCDPAESSDSRATLLLFGKRKACEPLSVAFFAREHGLTAAEGAVLQALCGGLCPVAIGKQSGVALSTVRSHVANIRLKTGSKSIGDLVRRVTLLPPIVSILG